MGRPLDVTGRKHWHTTLAICGISLSWKLTYQSLSQNLHLLARHSQQHDLCTLAHLLNCLLAHFHIGGYIRQGNRGTIQTAQVQFAVESCKPFWREAQGIRGKDGVADFLVELVGLEVRVPHEQRVAG